MSIGEYAIFARCRFLFSNESWCLFFRKLVVILRVQCLENQTRFHVKGRTSGPPVMKQDSK